MSKMLVAAVFAAALNPSVSTAATAGEGDTISIRIPYDDLDLTSAAGRDRLEKRIADAASQICQDPGNRDLKRKLREHSCFREMRATGARLSQLAVDGERDEAKAGRSAANQRATEVPVSAVRPTYQKLVRLTRLASY